MDYKTPMRKTTLIYMTDIRLSSLVSVAVTDVMTQSSCERKDLFHLMAWSPYLCKAKEET